MKIVQLVASIKLGNSTIGDTIVEVLLVMSIVGLVIGVSYSLLSRSITIQRINQERSAAYSLAQGQLESLTACLKNACTHGNAGGVPFNVATGFADMNNP